MGNETSNARRGLEFRRAFLAGITPEDITAMVRVVVERGKGGDLAAIRLVLDRCLGPDDLRRWQSEREVKQAEDLDEFMG